MSIINNISKPVATLAFTALLPTSVWAQTNITGRVTDAVTGDPLIGAIISVKGQKTAGAITNTDGEFSVHSAKNTPVSIVVSYVGYRSQQIDVYDAVNDSLHKIPLSIQEYFM